MEKKKYRICKIDNLCRFYTLDDSNGRIIASIEYCGYKSFNKYEVYFACYAVEDNLNKTRSFETLKEAKIYINEVLKV